MTYFGVLLRFVGPPLAILAAITAYDLPRDKRVPPQYRTWPAWAVLLGHVAIALIYTTPWDNYLVANRVWWYDPLLVTGIVFGWVPIEEYTFFVVQTLMTGLWLWLWMRRIPPPQTRFTAMPMARWVTAGLVGITWVVWLILLLAGWRRGWYMELLLVWFLPPIILQLGFGADILWHHRRLVLVGLVPPFVYLCVVDAIAIHSGTWSINPANTVGLDLFGVLPLEEITFFLLTNVLISFGMTLMLAQESHVRANTRVGRRLSASPGYGETIR
jgi:lycopene cyclase domain-containing protein